jgi:tetratricopeptide (TPR) repeat protein
MRKYTYLLLALFFIGINTLLAQVKRDDVKKLIEEGKTKKALELVQKDIDKNGENPDNLCMKSDVLMFINGDKCWENIQYTLQKFPKSPRPYISRAMFYYELRQMQNSLNDYTKALEYCSDDSTRFEILINRSGTYHNFDQAEASIADVKEALKIRPGNIDALNNLATNLFDHKEYEEAEATLLQMKAVDSTYMGVYINLGYQLQQRGDYKKAEYYLLQGLAISPDHPYVLNNLGYTQLKLGKTKEALASVNRSLKFYPENSYAYRNLALIYIELKDKVKACENIQKALAWKFTEMYGNEVKELREKHCL